MSHIQHMCAQNTEVTASKSPQISIPDSKVYGANMGPIWGWKDPGGAHVGPMNLVIWDIDWTWKSVF